MIEHAKESAHTAKPKPDHYKVICISLYVEDLTALDGIVRDLKRGGRTKVSRSSVLREAMRQFESARAAAGWGR